jgi:hypothetical protein
VNRVRNGARPCAAPVLSGMTAVSVPSSVRVLLFAEPVVDSVLG